MRSSFHAIGHSGSPGTRGSVRLRAAARTRFVVALAAAVGVLVVTLAIAGVPGDSGRAGDAGPAGQSTERPARNVILILGDGLGADQRRLIRETTVGPDGRLAMDRLPHVGHVRTSNAKRATTDSAAAATALATGTKTTNGAVGVDQTGRPLTSILDLASRSGRSTGLVTTARVTDATPAAFGASVQNRSSEREIARQYLEHSRPTIMFGGGRDRWSPELLRRARRLGYRYADSPAELDAYRRGPLLGLFADGAMYASRPEREGGRYRPSVPLAAMTRKALAALASDRQGFFLLVEEEAIDDMAHNNNAPLMIRAGRALDGAVRAAREFARRNSETLVIVVGDHETGGLKVEPESATNDGDGPFRVPGSSARLQARWATQDHTGEDVPVTAEGPGAHRFAGRLDNTDVFRRLVAATRLRTR